MDRSEERLASEGLGRLMLKMAIPSVVAQLINVLYNIVDRIYIGHLSGFAFVGVGVTFPIITFISAFSVFVGAGGAPLSSIWYGKGDKDRAEKILGNGASMLIFFSIVCMLVFYSFMDPMLLAFGADSDTIAYGKDYLSVYLVGTVFVQLSLGLNQYIVAQGASRTAMISVLIGAIANIILDPIFIFALKLGVVGAAMATVISQAISAVWVVLFLISKKADLKIKLKNMKPEMKIIGSIAALGISPFVMRSTESLVGIALNSGMKHYGDMFYVGSITIMQSVMQLFTAPLSGFTQGVQPIISFNYGAGNFERTKKAYTSMILISSVFSFVFTLLIMIFPSFFASIFTDSKELIHLCRLRMPLFISGMLVFGVQMGIQPTFMALGQAKISLFIATLRKIILLVPLAIILPIFWGTDGIYIAEPIADFTSAFVAFMLFIFSIKGIMTKEALNKIK